MNQLKGTAKGLKISKIDGKGWLSCKAPVYKARMMVGGQAVCLVTHKEINIVEGDQVMVMGTVRRGVLYARSYANGTRDEWDCRSNRHFHSLVSAIIALPAGFLTLLNVIPFPVGLALVLASCALWSAAAFDEYRHRKQAQRALHRYKIGPPIMRNMASA